MYVYMYVTYMYVYHIPVWCPQDSEEGVGTLWIIVNQNLGAGDWTWVLCKNRYS